MKKLLVVVDMQKDFVTGCLGTKEARAITEKLAEYAETFDGDVVFTRDTHGENYPDTQEGKKLPVVHCIKGSDGWELVP
ncbi:MAG: isochorismatase family protein, partial [Lachnospiraceae bacterium]|nr:isochorismatase family protein [Lachnospiraceae bacterium]